MEVADLWIEKRAAEDALYEVAAIPKAYAGMQAVVVAVVGLKLPDVLVVVLVPEVVVPETVAYADDPRSLFIV